MIMKDGRDKNIEVSVVITKILEIMQRMNTK